MEINVLNTNSKPASTHCCAALVIAAAALAAVAALVIRVTRPEPAATSADARTVPAPPPVAGSGWPPAATIAVWALGGIAAALVLSFWFWVMAVFFDLYL